jgi:hypothetical protein
MGQSETCAQRSPIPRSATSAGNIELMSVPGAATVFAVTPPVDDPAM